MKTKVADLMSRRVMAAREDAEFKEIVKVMRVNHVSALPVLDAGDHVIGVVSEADLLVKQAAAAPRRAGWRRWLPAAERKAAATTARGLMTWPAVTIGRDATAAEAAAVMSARRVKRLPVVDDTGHLVGIVSRVDVLSVYDREDHEIRKEITGDVIRGDLALNPDDFTVRVRSGIVTITGQVESKDVATQILGAIRHVEGVVDVRDRLAYPHEDPADRAKAFAFNAFTPKA